MAKPKTYIKEETVKRIKNLLKKYTKEELVRSKEFQSLETHYVNHFEREHLDTIVNLCYEDKTYDEIRLIIQGGTTTMSKTSKKKPTTQNTQHDENMDPVEEAVFMISQQKVVETEPVKVTINEVEPVSNEESETVENRNEAISDEVVNADEEMVDDSEPVILGDIIKNREAVKEPNANGGKDIITKSFDSFMDGLIKALGDAIAKADDYVKELEEEDRLVLEKVRKKMAEDDDAA